MEIALPGIGVSPGVAIGPAIAYGVDSLDISRQPVDDVDAEIARFDTAVAACVEDLAALQERTASAANTQVAGIFNSHRLLLEDVALREAVVKRVRNDRLNVEFIVNEVIAEHARIFQNIDDPLFRERSKDVLDVGRRILTKLLNAEVRTLAHHDRPSVIVAHDLSPSDTAGLDVSNTLGIATDLSGPTSHTAILARALEIPAVVGLKYVGQHTNPGDTIIVDGRRGRVVLRPTEATLAEYREEQERDRRERIALLVSEAEGPSKTQDGHPIPVMTNIELPVEVDHSRKARAEGVGLYRTEYLFLNRTTLPSEQEQFEAYAKVAEAFTPFSVTLRTLDLGGDKFASHLVVAEELNPQLGWRAIRFCLERPDIFKAQLRAMLRASVHGNVRIMFPLISGVDELRRVKAVVREAQADLERRGVAFDKRVKIGSMIEVPSAVLVADGLARECDFFSIGTNDLIQYSLAVDRVNEKIAHMYEPAHPAVLRMLQQTVKAARSRRIECSVCGEMAGDPLFTEILVGLGISSLSMASVAIPIVRRELNRIRRSGARRLARKVVGLTSSGEIRAMLEARFQARHTHEPAYGDV